MQKKDAQPNPRDLQQQIHDNDTVSTFGEKQDDDTIVSNPKGERSLPSPSKVMPSTISNSTAITLTPEEIEQLGNIMKVHIDECISKIRNQHVSQ